MNLGIKGPTWQTGARTLKDRDDSFCNVICISSQADMRASSMSFFSDFSVEELSKKNVKSSFVETFASLYTECYFKEMTVSLLTEGFLDMI